MEREMCYCQWCQAIICYQSHADHFEQKKKRNVFMEHRSVFDTDFSS